ncbi:Methyltransferase domain-containing protein [Acetitomaculum ruminis DSM 5522]|uniref:Methyltransferase domain-containing protein n=1 Tax=Acetitomaculum ruminis DSM 5522 TaxID=1120918 RepID=A0A1I0XM81_9FIRM|nr:class I SAM-dependent methyltransferase [Acetitomaculum ruminis]SFB02155.1 Methyltransferase domain-containing protein [Acetitomaculum ruminis DSM 5522]
MQSYSALSKLYDVFMDNVPYNEWAEFLKEELYKEDIREGLLLDLGCGTGKMTNIFSDMGYDMTGIDNSTYMLEEAISTRGERDILYLCQNMQEFELYGTVKAVFSVCDCINYILSKDELVNCFKLVNNYLDPKGLFIFDFNTKYKYKELIGEQTIAENRDEGSFIWDNYYYEDSDINEYELTIFLKREDGLYEKFEELHQQKGYDFDEMKALVEEAGLLFVKAYDGYKNEDVNDKSERIVMICRENGKIGG